MARDDDDDDMKEADTPRAVPASDVLCPVDFSPQLAQPASPAAAPLPVAVRLPSPAPAAPARPARKDADAEVAALRRELAAAVAERDALRGEAARLRAMTETFFNAVVLNPQRNERFAGECRVLLAKAIGKLDFVERLRWIDCSFPSTPANAPTLRCREWRGLGDSVWDVAWAPTWTCDVAVDARHVVKYAMLLRCAGLRLEGAVRVALTPSLDELRCSFVAVPRVETAVECSVTVGALPVPRLELLGIFEDRVRSEFLKWLTAEMVAPAQFVHVEPKAKHRQPGMDLSPDDVRVATEAARAARARANPDADDPVC